ncbi:MFS transporter [Paraburkholderia sp. J63]|uniref:MFS transporter n=1 Tax=Paraburkholderia sp. J63 TaxID=2805434 RepID=UPI002ABDC5E0|nr:MFS transporter [Paraburkholderia sp. J63]
MNQVAQPFEPSISEFNWKSSGAAVAVTVGFLVGPSSVIGPPLGLFMLPVAAEFGIGRTGFSILMLMAAWTAAFVAPFAGRAIDRYGVRRIVLPAVFLFGLVEMALALARGSVLVYFGIYMLVGVLAGVQNPIAYAKVASVWFRRRRGLVLAVAAAIGSGGGGIIVPQIAAAAIDRGGWRAGYVALGIFIIIVGVPILFALLHEPLVHHDAKTLAEPGVPVDLSGSTRAEAIRSRVLWQIIVAMCLSCGSLFALSVHVPAMVAEAFHTPAVAATFLSIFAVGGVVSQLTCGFLLDRLNSPKVAAPYFFAAFLGAVAVAQVSNHPGLMLPGAFLLGMGLGADISVSAYFVSRFFGLRAYGEIYGLVYASIVAGAGLGPVLVGIAFDRLGSYDHALTGCAIALAASSLLIVLLPRYVFRIAGSHAN